MPRRTVAADPSDDEMEDDDDEEEDEESSSSSSSSSGDGDDGQSSSGSDSDDSDREEGSRKFEGGGGEGLEAQGRADGVIGFPMFEADAAADTAGAWPESTAAPPAHSTGRGKRAPGRVGGVNNTTALRWRGLRQSPVAFTAPALHCPTSCAAPAVQSPAVPAAPAVQSLDNPTGDIREAPLIPGAATFEPLQSTSPAAHRSPVTRRICGPGDPRRRRSLPHCPTSARRLRSSHRPHLQP